MTQTEQVPALECSSVGVINLDPFADGRIYELVRGEDFPEDYPLELLRALLRYAAKHGELGITTTKTVDGLAMQILPLAVEEGPKLEYGPDGIAHLEVSVRVYNKLRRRGIETITQLAEKTEEELKSIPHFGVTNLHEVTEALATRGLRLRTKS